MAFEAKYAIERPNLVVGFLALFGFVAAAALRAAWRGTFHNIFQLLAQLLNVSIVRTHPFGFLADALNKADTSVYNWLGHQKDACGHAFVTLCLWVAMQVTMIVVAVAALSYELLRWAHVIGHRTSVTVVKKTVNVITKPIAHNAAKGAVAHDARVPALEREIDALRKRIGELDATVAKVQAVTVPVPALRPIPVPLPVPKVSAVAVPLPTPAIHPRRVPVPVPVPRISDHSIPKLSDLTDAWEAVKKRLGKVTKLGTIAGLIGLTAGVLGKLGLGWLRCARVGRVGRAVCGMNDGLLESLLADALLVVGAISIVEFAKELQTVEDEVVRALRGFVREL